MKNKIREILKGTYFGRDTDLGMACFYIIVESIGVTIVFSIGIFLFLGVISLILSFILSLIGIVNIIDRMLQISSIISIIGGFACCMLNGAEKGVRSFKEYLGLPFDELERILNILPFEKRRILEQNISEYIYKSIEKIGEDKKDL